TARGPFCFCRLAQVDVFVTSRLVLADDFNAGVRVRLSPVDAGRYSASRPATAAVAKVLQRGEVTAMVVDAAFLSRSVRDSGLDFTRIVAHEARHVALGQRG